MGADLVKFVPAVAYYFCLNLSEKFSQPSDHFSAQPYTKRNLGRLAQRVGVRASIMCGVIDVDAWATGRQGLDKIISPLQSDCPGGSIRQSGPIRCMRLCV